MKYIIIFFFITQFGFTQDNNINGLLQEGGQAYLNNDFIKAKEIYLKATQLSPKNKDGWYNLAAAELNLDEKENACEHLYKAYSLGDPKILDDIKRYCPNFRDGKIMSIHDVEEKPKFIYEGNEYELFENNLLNPLYLKILLKEIKKYPMLKNKLNGKLMIEISINSANSFDGGIILIPAKEEDRKLAMMQIISIFKNVVTYKAAKNKGVNVELFEKPVLPLQF